MDDYASAFGEKGLSVSESLKSAAFFLRENLTTSEKDDIERTNPSPDLGPSFCNAVELAAGSKDNRTLTIALMILSLIQAVENGIRGLLDFRSIIDKSTDHDASAVSDLIASTRNGRLEWSGELADHIVEVVAHLSRANRAIRLLVDWGWST
jgi:hypothetical protein